MQHRRRRSAQAQALDVGRRTNRARRRGDLAVAERRRSRPARRPARRAARRARRAAARWRRAPRARARPARSTAARTRRAREPAATTAAPNRRRGPRRRPSAPRTRAPHRARPATRPDAASRRAARHRLRCSSCAQRSAALPSGNVGPLATETLSSAGAARRCAATADVDARSHCKPRRTNAAQRRDALAQAYACASTGAARAMQPMLAPPSCSDQPIAIRAARASSAARTRARHAADPGPAARTRTSARRIRRCGAMAASARAIARDDVGTRMSVAVAIADGEHRMPRRHRGDERRRRRRAAAVMRHDEHVGRERLAPRRHQRDLADAPRCRRPAARCPNAAHDAQHAGQIVASCATDRRSARRPGTAARSARRPTPSAGRSGSAATDPRSACTRDDRTVVRQRGDQHADRHVLQHRQRAAAVIEVLVAHDHHVERADARRAQVRNDDAAAGVGRLVPARPGVVEERARMRLHDDRRALPDVERGQPERARRRAARAARGTAARAQERRASVPACRVARGKAARLRHRSTTAHAGGWCCAHAAPSSAASASSARISGSSSACAARHSASNGSSAAASVNGTIANVTSGIATAFASGPISETCWNSASDSGTSPTVIAHWACAAVRNSRQRPRRRTRRACRRQASARDVDQQPDGEERQPEPRREHRPRIPGEHGDERPDPDDESGARAARSTGRAPTPRASRACAAPAPRRRRAARSRTMRQGPTAAATLRAGTRDVSARKASRDAERDAAGEHREHRDVQAADADQVADAGAVEHRPRALVDARLVADRERDQHRARDARRRARACAFVANRFARALDVVERRARERIDAPVRLVRPHVTGGAQVALEQPRFEIEPAAVRVAVRATQPHVQRPAFRRADRGHLDAAFGVRPADVPGQRDPSRHARARRHNPLDAQARSDARDPTRAADRRRRRRRRCPRLPTRRQFVGQSHVGAPRGIAEAGEPGAGKARRGSRRAIARTARTPGSQRDRRRAIAATTIGPHAGDPARPLASAARRCRPRTRRESTATAIRQSRREDDHRRVTRMPASFDTTFGRPDAKRRANCRC